MVAAESAGALIGAEMGHEGLPWRADAHDEVLRELLGEQPAMGGLPRRLGELKEQIARAFGGARFNPESPAEVLRAFYFVKAGCDVRSMNPAAPKIFTIYCAQIPTPARATGRDFWMETLKMSA